MADVNFNVFTHQRVVSLRLYYDTVGVVWYSIRYLHLKFSHKRTALIDNGSSFAIITHIVHV